MKRLSLITVMVILAISLILMGCSSAPSPAATSSAPPKTSAPATSAPATTSAAPTSAAPSTSAAPASPSSTVKAAYDLKFAYHTPPKAGLVPQYYTPWAKDIETASGGKVAITHYAGGSLVPMESAYQAVLSGLADITLVETDSIPGAFPLSEINALPFAFPNAEVEARVFHELVLKYCVNTELKDVKVLAIVAISPAQYYGNKEVKKLEDLKGLKIRTSGKGEADIVSTLGASPVELSTGDIYSGLQKKTIDGVFFNTAGIPGFALQEVSKYRTICDLQPRAWLFVMNKKLYDGMPADVKAAFDKNSTPDVSAKYSAAYEKTVAIVQKNVIEPYDQKVGNPPYYTLPADEKARWVAKTAPIIDKWIADMEAKKLPGKAIWADAQDLVKKYSAK